MLDNVWKPCLTGLVLLGNTWQTALHNSDAGVGNETLFRAPMHLINKLYICSGHGGQLLYITVYIFSNRKSKLKHNKTMHDSGSNAAQKH